VALFPDPDQELRAHHPFPTWSREGLAPRAAVCRGTKSVRTSTSGRITG
jgi:hypothetical protein